MDTKLETGEAAPSGAFGTFTRRGARGRPGRRPAKNPEAPLGAEALVQTIHKDFAFVNEAFDGVGDPRCPFRILYSPATLLWTPTLGFMNRCDSRNAMDADRNDEGYALTVAALSAQDWWPEEEARTTPCMGTVCAFLEHVDPARLEAVLTKTVFRLIRRK